MKALFLIPFLFLPESTFTEIENPCGIMFPRGEDDCPYKEFRNGIGWVKAIDEKGFPNIWYSVTSY